LSSNFASSSCIFFVERAAGTFRFEGSGGAASGSDPRPGELNGVGEAQNPEILFIAIRKEEVGSRRK
jgi:hypothetical protein